MNRGLWFALMGVAVSAASMRAYDVGWDNGHQAGLKSVNKEIADIRQQAEANPAWVLPPKCTIGINNINADGHFVDMDDDAFGISIDGGYAKLSNLPYSLAIKGNCEGVKVQNGIDAQPGPGED